MSKDKNQPFDSPMTSGEAEIAGKLSASDLDAIDSLLVENISDDWLKSSFVIGGVMLKVPDEYEELPDVFYSSRLIVLEEKGLIEVRGDLRKMKHSEIRLS